MARLFTLQRLVLTLAILVFVGTFCEARRRVKNEEDSEAKDKGRADRIDRWNRWRKNEEGKGKEAGEDMGKETNPCLSAPCINQGTCWDLDGPGYVCTNCSQGYGGRYCEIITSPCVSSPCLNGTCGILPGFEYVCICDAGFVGAKCETDLFTESCVDGTCVWLHTGAQDTTFDAAVKYCTTLGAFPVEPNTESKWNAVLAYVRGLPEDQDYWWMGAVCEPPAINCIWPHSQENVGFNAFDPRREARRKDMYFYIYKRYNYTWGYDGPGDENNPICERQ